MDVYLTSLAVGGLGLVAMAVGGFGRHGHNHGQSHGHASGQSGGHGNGGSHGHGHASAGHSPAAGPHAAQPGTHATSTSHQSAGNALLALMSPRVLFSVCLGIGTTGLLLRPVLSGLLLLLVALAGGWLFERFIVTPIWNFTSRFASNPALTLESALMSEATAVTRFDANGHGLVAIEVDGHVVQLLGTLQPAERAHRALVLVGTRLRVEDVDAARNRCTVSLLQA